MSSGQVAFIAIIGILVIIAVAGAYFIFSPKNARVPETQSTGQLAALQACAQQAFDQSIALSGLYGGWTTVGSDFVNKGDYFNMSGRRFAIWTEPAQIPSVQELDNDTQTQLVSRIVSGCLGNVSGSKDVSVSVQLRNGTSRAAVQVNGSFATPGGEQRIPPFIVESSQPIVQARDVAESFATEVWRKQILKDLNFNIIALDKQVPLDGVDYTCQPHVWSVGSVKNAFYSSVQDAVPYVSFDGTPRVSDPNVSSKLTFDVSSLPADVPVSAYYFTEYGGTFDVQRSSGDLMTSMVTKSVDGVLCQNTYQFWYSMDYPIVFTLKVPDRTGTYLFRFAMAVDVARNHLPGSAAEAALQGSTFCSEVTPRTFTLHVLSATAPHDPVSNVTATYECGSQSCGLNASEGSVSDHLPARCLSADIVLNAPGYAENTTSYEYDKALSGSTVYLAPLKRVDLKLQCSASPDGSSCPFSDHVMARVNGTDYPLALGVNYLPDAPGTVSVLKQLADGSVTAVGPFTLSSGTDITLALDTDAYAHPAGLSGTQLFPSGVSGGSS